MDNIKKHLKKHDLYKAKAETESIVKDFRKLYLHGHCLSYVIKYYLRFFMIKLGIEII